MPVTGVTPQAAQGITTNQLVASFDFLEPQQLNELMLQHGDQFASSLLLRSLGREEAVSASFWWAWEDQEIIENFVAASITSAGVTGTLTLAATDVNAAGFSYPINFDLIQVVTNGQKLRLTNKTVGSGSPYTTTFTVSTLDASTSVLAASSAQCFIYSTAQATGMGQKDPQTTGVVKRTFYTQNFKRAIGADGGVLADATRITRIEGGGVIEGFHTFDTLAMELRIMSDEEGAFWIGDESQLTETSLMNGQQNPIYNTRGLFPTASLYGISPGWGGSTFTTATFDTIIKSLTRQRVTSPYIMGIQGVDLDTAIQNYLYGANLNTQVEFSKMVRSVFGGDEGLAMSVNFNQYTKGNYSFLWKMNPNFSNPSTFGSSVGGTFDYAKMGVWMPLSRLQDPTTGQTYPNIHYRYKGMGAYNRRLRIYSISGAGEQPMFLTEVDGTKTFGTKESGIGICKANQLIYMAP